MTCDFCGKPAAYCDCEQQSPLEATKCYSCVDEGDMDFGKLAKIFEDLPCKNIDNFDGEE